MTTRKKIAAGGEPAAGRRRVKNRHTNNPIITQNSPFVKKVIHPVLQPLIALAVRRGDVAILRELAALALAWEAR